MGPPGAEGLKSPASLSLKTEVPLRKATNCAIFTMLNLGG